MFDLPADAVAGVPRVEVIGDGELRMAPHRGILAYGSEEIHISGGNLVVLVRGSGLADYRRDPHRGIHEVILFLERKRINKEL